MHSCYPPHDELADLGSAKALKYDRQNKGWMGSLTEFSRRETSALRHVSQLL